MEERNIIDPSCLQINNSEKKRINTQAKTKEHETREICLNWKEYLKKGLQAECIDQRFQTNSHAR